jgi:ABC-2 type transport system ATP-binding protein
MTRTPTLIADRLTKRIGRRTIVDDVSFAVQPAEIFGFLGPNGAGKTTTIRMLVGLIRPTAGTARICGFDVRRQFERATRCVGSIIETPDLYRFMSGRENLEHFARMLGIADRGEIDRVSDLVDLRHRLDEPVRTYSLGMRQRLGIAQAMLGNPSVLILDEPANGLDPAGIREIRKLLRTLAHEMGLSIFISSHLLAEIELICDRVAIIHRGRVLRTGSVSELIASAQKWEVRADSAELAHEVIRQRAADAELIDDRIIFTAEESDVPGIVSAMVEGGVSVRQVQRTVRTLEDMFLEATGGETVT